MNAPLVPAEIRPSRIAIACQGGGSHAAFVAGTLRPLLQRFRDHRDNPLQLVALSGTSGGAICAVVAWWGLLTGGPDRAIERLEMFWHTNSALRNGEALANAATINTLESLPCEMQWSPYLAPLREMILFNTTVWPMIASAGFGDWIRPSYFDMAESLRTQLAKPHDLDFDTTVAAIGDLCSVPAEVQAWLADALDEALGGLPGGRRLEAPAERYRNLLDNLNRAVACLQDAADQLAEPAWLLRAMDELRATALPEIAALDAGHPETYQQGEDLVLRLERALASTLRLIPRLFIGAVDVGSGEFRAFRSDRKRQDDGISIEAVLASAAIPYLFKAVDIDDAEGRTRSYWDGLFSENPPIRTFTAPPGETPSAGDFKPDEIWIAQVNPRRCRTHDEPSRGRTKTTAHFDIFDRRNELSGNLSLFQEIGFIDAINRQLDHREKPLEPDYRHIQVFTIPLDDPAAQKESGRLLGFASKLDRDRRLKDALMRHGAGQGEKFLAVRDFVTRFLNQRDRNERQKYLADAAPGLEPLLGAVDRLHRQFDVQLRVFIEELAIGDHPSCDCRHGRPWNISLHWYAAAMTSRRNAQERAELSGRIQLDVDDGVLVDGLLCDVRIVENKQARVMATPPGPQAALRVRQEERA